MAKKPPRHNESLTVDVLARELPDRVALCAGRDGDAEEALTIVHDLRVVLEAYELRLRTDSAPTSGFVGHPLRAKFVSVCPVCRKSVSVGEDALFDPERPTRSKVAHRTCGAPREK